MNDNLREVIYDRDGEKYILVTGNLEQMNRWVNQHKYESALEDIHYMLRTIHKHGADKELVNKVKHDIIFNETDTNNKDKLVECIIESVAWELHDRYFEVLRNNEVEIL